MKAVHPESIAFSSSSSFAYAVSATTGMPFSFGGI
jgi:hypothetical protein